MKATDLGVKVNDQGDQIGINETEIESIKGDLQQTKSTNEILNNEVEKLQLEVDSLRELSDRTILSVPAATTNHALKEPNGTKTGSVEDYMNTTKSPLKAGNYVVVGVFGNQQNADKFSMQFNGSIVILNKYTNLYYVYTYYNKDLDPVRPKLAAARSNIDKESWILKLH
jgi:hypothetical protein